MGTLDIGLLRHAADEIVSVARGPGLAGERLGTVLQEIAARLVELADLLALEAAP